MLPDYVDDPLRGRFYDTFKLLGVSVITYGETRRNIPRIIEAYNEKHTHFFYTKCPVCHRDLILGKYISLSEAKKIMDRILDNDVLFVDRISDGIKMLASEFNEKGKKVFYEPNSGRNLDAVIAMTRKSNIVKFSTDRISMKIADKIIEECKDGKLDLVIATQGESGLQFSYRTESGYFTDWITGPYIEFETTVDTSGAGDWLSAGFLHFWADEGFLLERDCIYGSLKKGLFLSDVCSQTEGAQGVFYNDLVLKTLKRRFHIKLESRLEAYLLNHGDENGKSCLQCLLEYDD